MIANPLNAILMISFYFAFVLILVSIFWCHHGRANDIDIKIYGTRIQQVYVTKFLGAQIDAHLTWKNHTDYTCSKLSKCVGILAQARKKLSKSSQINLYYSFAYPYLIYCNHVWGNNYTTSLEKLHLDQTKLLELQRALHFMLTLSHL